MGKENPYLIGFCFPTVFVLRVWDPSLKERKHKDNDEEEVVACLVTGKRGRFGIRLEDKFDFIAALQRQKPGTAVVTGPVVKGFGRNAEQALSALADITRRAETLRNSHVEGAETYRLVG